MNLRGTPSIVFLQFCEKQNCKKVIFRARRGVIFAVCDGE